MSTTFPTARRRRFRFERAFATALTLAGAAVSAPTFGAPPGLAAFVPLGEAALEAARGGAQPTLPAISVDVSQRTSVDGGSALTSTWHIGDAATPDTPPVQSAGLQVIQVGSGNTVAATAGPSTGTVVQNTLDNQSIRTLTVIDVRAASLALTKGMNLQAAVSGAMAAALRR